MTHKKYSIVIFSHYFLSRELPKTPNSISSVVGVIRQALVELNHWRTLLINVLVKVHSINVWSMESFCPQYRHSSSFLIPNLSSSLFVTVILCINLKWSSLSLFSLQAFFSDLKIFNQSSSFNERLLLHRVGPKWLPMWVLLLSNL